MIFSNKAAVVNQLKANLVNSRVTRERALIRIFQNQTTTEQKHETVQFWNGIGFTHADARLLSSFAKQYLRTGNLSQKQDAILVKKIQKYARQLVEGSIREGKIVKVKNGWTSAKNV